MAKTKKPAKVKFIPCELKQLPESDWVSAADEAIVINPANRPQVEMAPAVDGGPGSGGPRDMRARLAVLTTKYWGVGGVKLGVAFVDGSTPGDVQSRILGHMNAWGQTANVLFTPAGAGVAEVRISRQRGGGYWSYLGTDVRRIPSRDPTMNLDSFSMSTPEREYVRVVRHETGHTLGFPHEHLRRALVERLDVRKTLDYFRRTQGWSESTTRSNVLTPIEESAIIGTPLADDVSIMAYQLPASITKDGKPIPGGPDINVTDATFCAKIYPGAVAPPPPPEGETLPIPVKGSYKLVEFGGKVTLTFNPE